VHQKISKIQRIKDIEIPKQLKATRRGENQYAWHAPQKPEKQHICPTPKNFTSLSLEGMISSNFLPI